MVGDRGSTRRRGVPNRNATIIPLVASSSNNTEYVSTTKPKKRMFKGGKRKNQKSHFLVLVIAFMVLFTFLISTLLSPNGNEWTRHEETNPPGTCINDVASIPSSWKPADDFAVTDEPWSAEEQTLANHAVADGLEELVVYLDSIPRDRVKRLEMDAVNCLIDDVYSSSNMPVFHERAVRATKKVLKISTEDYVSPEDPNAGCILVYEKMKFVGYANYLSLQLPHDEELLSIRNTLVERLNVTFQECETLNNVLGQNVDEAMPDKNEDVDWVYNWTLEAIALTDCMTVPGLQMPQGTSKFIADVWTCLEEYPYPNARDVENGFRNGVAVGDAYLATHAAYVPTGYGRHLQLVKEAPWLFRYLRENFYGSLESDDLDLVSEFVDILRQYGCSEDNDVQVRHGSRYLLNTYAERGNSWMGPHEIPKEIGDDDENNLDYKYIHRPWTGVSGVERRQVEPIVKGSYGYAFRQALKNAGYKEVAAFDT